MSTTVAAPIPLTLPEILNNVRMLGEEDQLTVYNRLRDILFPTLLPSVALIDDLKEKRFHKGLNCPHCGSEHVNRRGTYRGRRRYSCKDCMRTFNDMTATPMAGTHMLEK